MLRKKCNPSLIFAPAQQVQTYMLCVPLPLLLLPNNSRVPVSWIFMRLYTLTTYIGIIGGGGGLKAFLRQAKVVRLIFDLRVGRSILLPIGLSQYIFSDRWIRCSIQRDTDTRSNALEVELKDIDPEAFSIFMGK